MILEHIRFKNRQALKIEIKSKNKIDQALEKLGLEENRPVIVISGGAGGIRKEDWEPIHKVIEIVARTADEINVAVVDGGTDSGVMAAMGQIRTQNVFNFPLIGVAAVGTVKWPGRKMGILERIFLNQDTAPLDPNHTHFILVPGKDWGDESSWIAEVATRLAGARPSIAVLINGGRIARDMDIPYNIEEGRTVFVIEGTGRAADEIATHLPNTDLMHFIHISELDQLPERLQHCLHSAE